MNRRFEMLDLLDGMKLLQDSDEDSDEERFECECDVLGGTCSAGIPPPSYGMSTDAWLRTEALLKDTHAVAITGYFGNMVITNYICQCGFAEAPEAHKVEIGSVGVVIERDGGATCLLSDERSPSRSFDAGRSKIWTLDFDFSVPIRIEHRPSDGGGVRLVLTHKVCFASLCPSQFLNIASNWKIRYVRLRPPGG